MDTNYQILPIGEEYLSEIMAIERSVFQNPWSTSLMRDSLLSASCSVWGLFDQENLLKGFTVISMVLDEAEILDISVDKSAQNQGYGQKLLAFVMSYLAQQGVEKIFLEVQTSNEAALAMYRKFNFSIISTRKNYYQLANGQFEDAYVLQGNIDEIPT